MDAQFIIDTVSRVVHVATAIVLTGGMVFMLYVLMPAGNTLEAAAHDRLREGVMARWKRFVHVGILLFLITGFYNYFQQMPKHKGDGLYHALLGTKMIMAFIIFFIASALVGRSAAFAGMREKRKQWQTIVVMMALVIVAISGFLKVRGPRSSEVPTEKVVSPAATILPAIGMSHAGNQQ